MKNCLFNPKSSELAYYSEFNPGSILPVISDLPAGLGLDLGFSEFVCHPELDSGSQGLLDSGFKCFLNLCDIFN